MIEETTYFRDWKTHSRLSETSKTAYATYIRDFGRHLESYGFHEVKDLDFTKFYEDPKSGRTDPIDQAFIEEYLAKINACHSETSQVPEQTATALKNFFKTLYELDRIPFDPTENVKVTWVTRRPREGVLSEKELTKLMNVAYLRAPQTCEYECLVMLLDSGLRNGEIRSFTADMLDFDRGIVKVEKGTKNGRKRYLPMSDEFRAVATTYTNHLKRQGFSETDLLFQHNGRQLYSRDLLDMVKKLAEEAGVTQNVFPHLFRHTTLTRLYQRGVPLDTIQSWAGHADRVTTTQYVHVSVDEQREKLQNSPMLKQLTQLAAEYWGNEL